MRGPPSAGCGQAAAYAPIQDSDSDESEGFTVMRLGLAAGSVALLGLIIYRSACARAAAKRTQPLSAQAR
jgi:hypothetical protein